jgi:hypothetical protein
VFGWILRRSGVDYPLVPDGIGDAPPPTRVGTRCVPALGRRSARIVWDLVVTNVIPRLVREESQKTHGN